MPNELPKIPAISVKLDESQRRHFHTICEGIFDSGIWTNGTVTEAFENEFAREHQMREEDYQGEGLKWTAPNAIAVSSCSAGLYVALQAIDVGFEPLQTKTEYVVVPANSFFATVAAVRMRGAHVVYADCGHDGNVTMGSVVNAIARSPVQPSAVMLVHIGGKTVMDRPVIIDYCRRNDIRVVEDMAHSHGVQVAGDVGVYSMYPTKITSSGEGGMIVTSDKKIAERCRVLRDHGKRDTSKNYHDELGFNWRMSEVSAALGLVSLSKMEEHIARRIGVAEKLDKVVIGEGGPVGVSVVGSANYYKYSILCRDDSQRVRVQERLKSEFRIGLPGRVFDIPLPLQPGQGKVESMSAYGGCRDWVSRHLCLPMRSDMRADEVEYVVSALRTTLREEAG